MSQTVKPADALRSIVERATTDPVFRTSLKQNPNLTLEAELNRMLGTDLHLPAGSEIVVLEDTMNRMHLVIPAVPAVGDRQLSDAEMESVAGGSLPGLTLWGCR